MNITATIIENYCDNFDITINTRKTKWMQFGPNVSIAKPIFLLNNAVIEEVKEFKFLGVILTADNISENHLKKRKSLCMMGISEITNIGFNSREMPSKMKALLYTSLARSKLSYGLENIKISTKQMDKLATFESNIIKRANGVSCNSRSTILLYAMEITPIKLYIIKRRISLLIQLLKNEATIELVSFGIHNTLNDIIDYIGVKKDHIELGDTYRTALIRASKIKLKEIEDKEIEILNGELVTAIRYLINNRNEENEDTLQFLLDPRRQKFNG
jgi:hypothetical protein